MSQATKFKVRLEFEIDISPIPILDLDSIEKLISQAAGKKSKMNAAKQGWTETDMRAAMKTKGMTDADIEKALAGAKAAKEAGAKGAAGKGLGKGNKRDPQMLLYPNYENWAAAQQTLQQEILNDDALSTTYVREVVRDLTCGRIESLLEDKYGAPDLNGAIMQAMQKLSPADKTTLKSDEPSLLHDETELMDDSVDCRFTDMIVTRI